MPRVTRAALRTNVILEDEASLAAAIPLPSTPTTNRMPLGEVIGNLTNDNIKELVLEDAGMPTKRGRKPKSTKDGKTKRRIMKKNDLQKENGVEVLEDDYESASSSAVEEACKDLLKASSGDNYQIPMHDTRPNTPPSKAVLVAVKQLGQKSHTPRFDPDVHQMPKPDATMEEKGEDSFVSAIGTRTPAKTTRIETFDDDGAEISVHINTTDTSKDDSSAEEILTRSATKPTSRIEDSVEAIDALEEAIEKIGESLATIADEPQSPVKNKKADTVSTEHKPRNPLPTKKSAVVAGKATKPVAVKKAPIDTMRKALTRNSPPKASIHTTPRTSPTCLSTTGRPTLTKRATPSSLKPSPSRTSASTRPSVSALSGKPVSTKPRVSSITKAPFVPVPSTKAPTRSTFTLPGDAISQKLKVQREERLKREEDENARKRTFKARPVRLSAAPVVIKGTVSSTGRLSLVSGNGMIVALGHVGTTIGDRGNENGLRSKPINKSALATRVSVTSATADINDSVTTNPMRSPTLRKISPNAAAKISASRGPSLSEPAKGTLTAKGKEVFGRAMAEKQARETMRKEKEDAAKRARAEAAERGRVASREWAEKMRLRKEKTRKENVATGTRAQEV